MGGASPRVYDELDFHTGIATVRPGITYAAQAKARVLSGAVELRLCFLDADDVVIESATSSGRSQELQKGWRGLAVSATAPAGAATARIDVNRLPEAGTSAEVADIRLVTPGVVRELGTPLHTSAVHSAVSGRWRDGTPVIFAVMRGRPGRLCVLNPRDGHTIAIVPLTTAGETFGAFGITQGADGTVYIGGSNGHLYRYAPDTDAVDDIDCSAGDTSMLWHVVVDDDGRVFSGTYRPGEVIRYDPRDGSIVRKQVAHGLDYTRSVAVADGVVWAGMGTPSRLFRVDADTLEVIDEVALPEELTDQPMIYDLVIIGRKLFARGSGDGSICAFDLDEQTWGRRLGIGRGVGFTPDPAGAVYWLASTGTLHSCTASGHVSDTGVRVPATSGHLDVSPMGYGWADGLLVSIDAAGTIHNYDPRTRTATHWSADLPRNEHRIHRLTSGSDGRIYVTGFAPGGLAWYDPTADGLYEGPEEATKQAEFALDHDGRLWLGTYPGAGLLAFDPNRKVVAGENPEIVASLANLSRPEQDRPYAMAGGPAGLFIGTVPVYGRRGGKLFFLPRGSREPREVPLPESVAEHSVTALAYDSATDSLYVGTCLLGGLGLPPAVGAARLLRLTLPDLRVVWDVVPDAAEPSITSLLALEGKDVWGVTPGSVFTIDPAGGDRREIADIAPFIPRQGAVWSSGRLVADAAGGIYAQVNGQLVVFADSPLDWTVLATDTSHGTAALFARDDAGNAYFAKDATLYQLTPPQEEVEDA